MSLGNMLREADRFITLYGTTPPRLDTPSGKYDRAITRLAERVAGQPIDGLVVYDVQDESTRTSEPRPFPFLPTHPSRSYAARLQEATRLPAVVYKCVAGLTEAEWTIWLDETADRSPVPCLSLVGRASSKGISDGVSLLRALEMARAHPGGFTLGGVVIPERHRPAAMPPRSESERLIEKGRHGCAYFISQAIYDPAPAIRLIQDYHTDCVARGITPARILLTFTPSGRPKTLEFMKWLGIYIPAEVETALLQAADMLEASVALCRENLRTILESGVGQLVPLGINIESVSITKEEIEASIALCTSLREIARAVITNDSTSAARTAAGSQ